MGDTTMMTKVFLAAAVGGSLVSLLPRNISRLRALLAAAASAVMVVAAVVALGAGGKVAFGGVIDIDWHGWGVLPLAAAVVVLLSSFVLWESATGVLVSLSLFASAVTVPLIAGGSSVALLTAAWLLQGILSFLAVRSGRDSRDSSVTGVVVSNVLFVAAVAVAAIWVRDLFNGGMVVSVLLLLAALFRSGAFPLFGTFDGGVVWNCNPASMLPGGLNLLVGLALLYRVLPSFDGSTYLMLAGALLAVVMGWLAGLQRDAERKISCYFTSAVGVSMIVGATGDVLGALVFACIGAVHRVVFLMLLPYAERRGEGNTKVPSAGVLLALMIAVLSVVGVPPLLGYHGIWRVYHALVGYSHAGGTLWVLWFAAVVAVVVQGVDVVVEIISERFAASIGVDTLEVESPGAVGGFGLLLAVVVLLLGAVIAGGGRLGVGRDVIVAVGMLLLVGVVVTALAVRGKVRVVEAFIGGEDPAEIYELERGERS